MPRGTCLTAHEKTVIDNLYATKEPVIKIAKILNRSITAVRQYVNHKTYSKPAMKRGRKEVLSPRTKRQITKVAANKCYSSTKIKAFLNLSCSVRTVQKTLKNSEFLVYKKFSTVTPLSDLHKGHRVAWSEPKLEWNNEWRQIIFSDEKKFNLDGPDGLAYYYHDIRTVERSHIKRQFGGGGVMVWAAIGWNGRTAIRVIESTMDAIDYQEVLRSTLLPKINEIAEGRPIFQQDNAPVHSARSTKDWLGRRRITVIDWPARSPDLNPIENCWGWLTRQVYADGKQFHTKDELKAGILKAWEKMPQEYIQKLFESMPRRVASVVEAGGCFVGY